MLKEEDAAARDLVELSGALKHDHADIQALFRRYLGSCSNARLDLAQEILTRLQLHLEMEECILSEAIRASGSHSLDLIGETILEHDEIHLMFCELLEGAIENDSWEERFEDMVQSARVHFMTEERELLPLVDRSRDA